MTKLVFEEGKEYVTRDGQRAIIKSVYKGMAQLHYRVRGDVDGCEKSWTDDGTYLDRPGHDLDLVGYWYGTAPAADPGAIEHPEEPRTLIGDAPADFDPTVFNNVTPPEYKNLLDEYAMAALTGLLARTVNEFGVAPHILAKNAFDVAWAMYAEKVKRNG